MLKYGEPPMLCARSVRMVVARVAGPVAVPDVIDVGRAEHHGAAVIGDAVRIFPAFGWSVPLVALRGVKERSEAPTVRGKVLIISSVRGLRECSSRETDHKNRRS